MQTEHATQDDVYAIGVIAEIKQIVKMQNHIVRVIVEAKEKAELAYFIDNDELLKAQVVLVEESEEKEVLAPEVEEAMLRALQEELLKYCASNPKIGKELKKQADGLNEIHSFIRIVAGNLPISFEKRQKLLETESVTEQYEALMQILLYETNIMQIKNELQEKVKERVDKNQKEYILREEMKSSGRNLERIIPPPISSSLRKLWKNWKQMSLSKNGFEKKLPVLKMWQTVRPRAALCAVISRRYWIFHGIKNQRIIPI